ncbi:MAG: T9SS type A sorting domain-containing protein [bacterium]|nr:T9SS type A sorting domain-containing protein [bacterium]
MSRSLLVISKRLRGALLLLAIMVICALIHSNLPSGEHGTSDPLLTVTGGAGETGLPPGVGGDWWTSVQGSIAASEYEFSDVMGELRAPNRAQDIRIRISTAGVRVEPRREESGTWDWAWRTSAWGRSQRPNVIASVTASGEAARAELNDVGFVEWYENTPEGLEQGFTIAEEPEGSGPLFIEGCVTGDLTGRLDSEGGVEFLTEDGALALRYDHLLAWDATGRQLTSEMTVAGDMIHLLVDDSDAVYPVVIDPLLSTPDWEWSSTHNFTMIGASVATAGDVNGDGYSDVIVGAPNYSYWESHDGRAFCFLGGPDGLALDYDWDQSTAMVDGYFGKCVSTAGDVNGDGYDDVIVGAPWHPLDGSGQGKVYIFPGSADGLLDTTFWTLLAVGETHLGFSVANAGDVNGDGFDDVIVGEPEWSDAGGDVCGRVRIFSGSSTTMNFYWNAWSGTDGDNLGFAVAGAGDVNGDGYDDVMYSRVDAVINPGLPDRVTVTYGAASGMSGGWIENGSQAGAEFGYSLSTAGDVNGDGYADILIGAPWMDDDDQYSEGWVYCYLGSADGVESSPDWIFESDQTHAHLGDCVATAGDVNGDGFADVIIGATLWDGGLEDEGRAWVFLGSVNGLADDYLWAREGNQADGEFGVAVATAGDVNGDGFSDVIVGAKYFDHGGYTDNGRAFVYLGGGYPCNEHPGWYSESNQTSAYFGMSAAGVGDVNGDGYGDVLVGASHFDNGQLNEGVVFLYLGSLQGLSFTPSWYAESNQANCGFGFSVAGAGDVNGDGLEDLIIGAPEYSSVPNEYEGAAFLWLSRLGGGPMGNPSNADWIYYCDQAGAHAGVSVCGGGDVNADGYADIFVGAYFYDNGTTNEGAVFGFHGSETGPSSEYDWFHDTNKAESRYGYTVVPAGDMNGDGFADLAVGAPEYDHPNDKEGVIAVYTGSESGLQTGAPWFFAEGEQTGAKLGKSLACAGDVNGDGYSDIIAGAPDYSFSGTERGGAFIWFGGATPPPQGTPDNADWQATWPEDYAHMGYAVSSAGDFDGDGFGDIVVAAPYADGYPENNIGVVAMFRGTSTGIAPTSSWMVFGDQDDCLAGTRLACVGDVNGDGFSDVISTSPYYNNGHNNEGVAWVFYGNGGRGLARKTQQWDGEGLAILAPQGMTSGSSMGISTYGRCAGGRGSVRMEVEVKSSDTPFDGTGTIFTPWSDLRAPDAAGTYVSLEQLVNGLADDRAYHWRMRVCSDKPQFPHSPWTGIPYDNMPNIDFRTGDNGVGVEETPVAGTFRLNNYPNPFNPTTTLTFNLTARGHARLDIFDAQGRRLNTLVDGVLPEGPQHFVWNGTDAIGRHLPSGVYFARLSADERTQSRKLMLLK